MKCNGPSHTNTNMSKEIEMELTDEEIIKFYIRGNLFKGVGNVIVHEENSGNTAYYDNPPEEVQTIVDAYLDSKGIKKVVHRQRQRVKKARRTYTDEKLILQNMLLA
jgi:hypothetical protein